MIKVYVYELELEGIPKKFIEGHSGRNYNLWHTESQIPADVSSSHTGVQEIDFFKRIFIIAL